MDIKGTAYLARKAMLEREIGEQRFADLLRLAAARDPVFASPILATTHLPLEAFIRFNELIVNELYDGDEQAYFRLGEQSASWSLTGPYKRLVKNRGIDELVASAGTIYRNYYSEGEASAVRKGNLVELRVDGIPKRCGHPFLDYAISGYFRRALEDVSGKPVKMRAIAGFARGDDHIAYEYTLMEESGQ